MKSKKNVTEIAQPAVTDEVEATETTVEETTAVEVLPYEPFTSQAAADAFEEFQTNPNKVFTFFTNEINIDHSLNGRRKQRSPEDADIISLAGDIARNGIIEPLIGWFEEYTGYAYIGAGYGRAVATELANLNRAEGEQILLRVVFDPSIHTKEDALGINISENVQRKNLNIMDVADDMKRMKDAGKSHVEIAEAFNMKSKAAVTGYLSLLKLPDYVQDAISAGVLSMNNGYELIALMKTAPEKVEKTAARWIAKAENEGKPPSVAASREDVVVEGGGSRAAAPMSFKELKEVILSSTGPGEDQRVSVVNMVLASLYKGEGEKEHGIGRVTAKNYVKKLVEALDKVCSVKAASKGKAA